MAQRFFSCVEPSFFELVCIMCDFSDNGHHARLAQN